VSELIQFLARSLVRHPGEIRVNEVQGDASILLELTVHPDDVARVRGPEDETLRAIRTVLSASSGRRKVVLELVDPHERPATGDLGDEDTAETEERPLSDDADPL